MMYNNYEIEILAHVLNIVNDCINNGEMDNNYIDIEIETREGVTNIFLSMEYNTTYEHRQVLLQLDRYIRNNSDSYINIPIRKYRDLEIENSIYKISDTFNITISWINEESL